CDLIESAGTRGCRTRFLGGPRHNRRGVARASPSICFAGCGSFAVLAARFVPRGCIAGGGGERFCGTAVAPIVSVKTRPREECPKRESLVLVPIAHERETMKHIDFFLLGGARDQIDHVVDLALSDYFRSVLRIDQHRVRADRIYSPNALADH